MRLKFFPSLLVSGTLVFFFSPFSSAFAQERGEGVGGLLNPVSGDTTVTISDGKTAPRAEIFIESTAGKIQALAKLNASGVFNFSFKTDSLRNTPIYMYAVDSIGKTAVVTLDTSSVQGVLLSPTLKRTSDPSDVSVAFIEGLSFPGASLDGVVTAPTGEKRRFQAGADPVTGMWKTAMRGLSDGVYGAEATAWVGDAVSLPNSIVFRMTGVTTTQAITVAAKILVAPALVGAVAPTVAAGGMSISTFSYYLARIGIVLGSLLTLRRRKREPWGVVYNAITKHPLGGVIVRLLDQTGKLLETEVTSTTGTFAFLPEAGAYLLRAVKPGFLFPSRFISGRTDGEYIGLYHGETLRVTGSTLLNLSIPLDPKEYREKRTVGHSFWNLYGGWIEFAMISVGFGVSVLGIFRERSVVNILTVGLYVLLFALAVRRGLSARRSWGTVVDTQGKPVPMIGLLLLDRTFNRTVQRRVTDSAGRFAFIAPNGEYSIVLNSDQFVLTSQKGSYSGEAIRVLKPTGLIRPRLVVMRREG